MVTSKAGGYNVLDDFVDVNKIVIAGTMLKPVSAASVLHLLQIGELETGLSDDFRSQHKCIPWKGIIGLRNIIAHRYGS